jgi:hypothetical protein
MNMHRNNSASNVLQQCSQHRLQKMLLVMPEVSATAMAEVPRCMLASQVMLLIPA